MGINLSDFFRSTNNQTVNTAINQAQNNSNSALNSILNNNSYEGMELLKNMLAGDTFTGKVNSIKNNTVNIIMNDGTSLNARLSDGGLVKEGSNVTFIIEENVNNKIVIKPLLANEQQALLIDRVLDGANLSPTDRNIDIVKELLNLNMPIDYNSVNELAKYSSKYPLSNINTLANLMRLEIPVNDNNINEFEAYKRFDSLLDNQLASLENSIVSELNNNTGTFSDKINLTNNIVNMLYEDMNHNMLNSSLLSEVFNSDELSEITDIFSNSGDFTFDTEFLDKLEKGDLTLKDLMNNINNSAELKNYLIIPDKIKEFFSSDKFKTIIHNIINDTMKLTPKDVAQSDGITNYYKRVKKNTQILTESITKTGIDTDISKSLNEIKSNIDFMNDLNKNMSYFQMPIKFSDSEGNGELYVFTNKKKLANKTDSISAMLHLDMDNLGSMDVYVKLAANNVSTNFILENEEMLDFVNSRIDILNNRLKELGYATHFEMKVNNNETDSFDFVKNFIESDIGHNNNSQYILDIKA